jgi:hypothetical protein
MFLRSVRTAIYVVLPNVATGQGVRLRFIRDVIPYLQTYG